MPGAIAARTDERRARRVTRGRVERHDVAREEPDGAGDEREGRRGQPHAIEVIVTEKEVAEERPERQSPVDGDRPIADRFAAS